MDYKEILGILITIGVFIGLALVGVGIRYLCKWLATKTNNEVLASVLKEIEEKTSQAVTFVNQTYVNALKKEGKFGLEAQAQAFKTAYHAVIETLSAEALAYVESISGDVDEYNKYLEVLIESAVNFEQRVGSGVKQVLKR